VIFARLRIFLRWFWKASVAGCRRYRLYRFNHAGSIIGFVELLCATDNEALEHARRLADDGRHELWSQGRFLAVIRSQTTA
jgi:hypothetical protein